MISIIVCSRNKVLATEYVENITNSIGTEFEIIHIDNSDQKHTIFTAYNAGYKRSKYPYLCFVHEDVLFHTQNWGEKLIAHLQDPKVGIIGMAGCNLVPRVPASWATLASNSMINIIQTDKTGKIPTEHLITPANNTLSKRQSVIIDGIMLCMRRELMEQIRFDENLKGFHGYDYDISLQATVAGYTNYVIYDVDLEHFSKGKTDLLYFRNLILICKKWEKYLPIIGQNNAEINQQGIKKLEKRKLYQLTKKMTRKGFEINEIVSEITYYSRLVNIKNTARLLRLRIILIRLFNCPKYLFYK